ncbi:MAG: UDP-N-acetylmuramoyl-L-alanyl-D-glutamate--2,6-diaminopimelate ligase [Bacillota bacterium]|nr:UDP-N-acetylmuramoyl-L-alanyl-D-glutamate--2,6-diaminopimelate ligase [Bacillota bacterium]
MLLGELLAADRATRLARGVAGTGVVNLDYDSRRVGPGSLFFALRGLISDGHEYVPQAVQRGAVAVCAEHEVALPDGVALLLSPDTRASMALMAAAFFGHPSVSLGVVGVTGTKGKTTTTHLIRAIFEAAGRRTGLVGTVHNVIGGMPETVVHTTPEAPELHSMFRRMVSAGDTHVVMEVSSHALEFRRVAGTAYDIGVLTNMSHDHLDLHKTFDNYVTAKAKLFMMLGAPPAGKGDAGRGLRAAVVNGDDPVAPSMRRATPADVPYVTFGHGPGCDLRALDVDLGPAGASFTAAYGQRRLPISLRLPGRFNVQNAMAALTVGLVSGCDPETCVAALSGMDGVPGRFERVDAGQPFAVIVDYAHSPDSLENVLVTARELTTGRLMVVFGCGGDRDRTKRPVMGRIAAERADEVLVTSDNPRSEDPDAIIAEIVAGFMPGMAGRWRVVADRAAAIRAAIETAGPGDMVVIAGKGHETYQILGPDTIHFDDREVARQALLERGRGVSKA